MIQLILGFVFFSGMFAVIRDRGHVNFSLFEPFLLKHFRRGYRSIFDVMSLIGTIAIAGILGWRVWDMTHYPETSLVLRLPMIWIIGSMALLAAIAILLLLAFIGVPLAFATLAVGFFGLMYLRGLDAALAVYSQWIVETSLS